MEKYPPIAKSLLKTLKNMTCIKFTEDQKSSLIASMESIISISKGKLHFRSSFYLNVSADRVVKSQRYMLTPSFGTVGDTFLTVVNIQCTTIINDLRRKKHKKYDNLVNHLEKICKNMNNLLNSAEYEENL